jgi:hypothetical protein
VKDRFTIRNEPEVVFERLVIPYASTAPPPVRGMLIVYTIDPTCADPPCIDRFEYVTEIFDRFRREESVRFEVLRAAISLIVRKYDV